jgi:hypothetical protein
MRFRIMINTERLTNSSHLPSRLGNRAFFVMLGVYV